MIRHTFVGSALCQYDLHASQRQYTHKITLSSSGLGNLSVKPCYVCDALFQEPFQRDCAHVGCRVPQNLRRLQKVAINAQQNTLGGLSIIMVAQGGRISCNFLPSIIPTRRRLTNLVANAPSGGETARTVCRVSCAGCPPLLLLGVLSVDTVGAIRLSVAKV